MSVLVVGATGFLGTEICRRLAEKGTPPRVLVRETSDPARVEALHALPNAYERRTARAVPA